MEQLGWEPYASDHEDGTAQFELNWKYADALTTADRYTFFKMMTSQVAGKHGRDRDAHAQAVQRPDRQRHRTSTSRSGTGDEPNAFLADRRATRGASASRSSPTTSWAACSPMRGR